MSVLRVGLVVEGPTDFIVLKKLLVQFASIEGFHDGMVFVDLQPSLDGTTGTLDGGWTAVYQWCLRNSPTSRQSFFLGSGLFANGLSSKACDIILVVMDSDIIALLKKTAPNVPVPSLPITCNQSGNYVQAVMNSWLWPNNTQVDNRHIVAPAVLMLETWLIAALAQDIAPEDLENPLRRLAEIEHERKGKPIPSTMKRVPKKPHRYEPLANAAGANIPGILASCIWFSYLTDRLRHHLSANNASVIVV